MTACAKWTIQIDAQTEPPKADTARLHAVVEAVLRRFRVRQATVIITLVGDEQMRLVHYQFLKKRSTTDVMSFDLTDEYESMRTFEVVVNADMAARQGRKRKHSAEAELALYITHGLLHQLGFDDLDGESARRMHQTEDAILKTLGYGAVYFDDDTRH